MKILNDPDKKWTMEVTCKECAALLEIEEADLEASGINYEDTPVTVNFCCSRCKSQNDVTKVVPSGISQAVINEAYRASNSYRKSFR
ncbi:hypothetical protein KAZ57_03880 [Patescibacteria group bacterium]|nr:hypothetical protein [Patescibacteria group bacterium]